MILKKPYRQEIFDTLIEERGYQDQLWGKDEHPLSQFLLDFEQLLDRAKRYQYVMNKEKVLDEIRKITALGVKAMEVHGLTTREDEEARNGN